VTETRRALAALVVLLAVAGSCDRREGAQSRATPTRTGSPSPTAGQTPAPSPTGSPPPAELGAVSVRATLVAPLNQPVSLAHRKGDDALFVAERLTGRVFGVRGNSVDSNPIVDIGAEISRGGEQGLLGVAFAPDGRRMYLNFTNTAGDTRVIEFTLGSQGADLGTRREILAVGQPFPNHNGGNLVFGPDGHLWIGLGDGGSGGDPNDNGQRLDTLLGKMLRIDPRPSGDSPYRIPSDNPFRGRADARPEIYAFGLRNPWRYSFDRLTEDFWLGDVGQNALEEIDFMPAGRGAGANYGWARLEGTERFRGDPPADAVPPIFVYPLGGGRCAVVGGHVYRGSRIPALSGAYLYSDNCDGRIRALVQSEGRVVEERDLGLEVPRMASFGEGPDGEIYLLSLSRGLLRLDPA
jgi:glucose/arabinose dehydrogenase